jgi:hypothetical protein
MIIDPGNPWHKDDMPDEEPRPGITEPNYDEHPDKEEADANNREHREMRQSWYFVEEVEYIDDEEIPF